MLTMLGMLGTSEIVVLAIAFGLCGLAISGLILFLLIRALARPARGIDTERRLEVLEQTVAELRRSKGS